MHGFVGRSFEGTLADGSQEFFQRLSQFRIDCARLVRRASARTDVVLLGDSIAAAAPMPHGWVNRGLANDSLNDANGDVFDRLTSEALHPNPLGIVVLFGRDDLRRGIMSIDELLNLYDHLITQLGRFHPTSSRIIANLPSASASELLFNANIAEFNEKLREIANFHGLPHWDLNERFREQRSALESFGRIGDKEPRTTSGHAITAAFLDSEWRASQKCDPGLIRSNEWVARLRAEAGGRFPEHVTAFRDEMAVHGKYGQPCPRCGSKVQRIRYASNETNYCPQCQTGGKLLADRGLSRLLREDSSTAIRFRFQD